MKKITFLFLLGLLIIVIPIYSQTLERGMWQLQNPAAINISSILSFSGENVSNSFGDMNTGQVRKAVGTYRYSGNTLSIVMNNKKYVYSVKWTNKNKLTLSSNSENLVYAQANTADDTYFSRYMAWYGMNWSNPNQNYNSPQEPRQELCYTCHGSGRCKICSGTGIVHNEYVPGDKRVCSACNGTGKCWHCHGSGKQ